MDAASFKFLVFALFGAACLVGGYVARVRGWLHEDTSRTLHFQAVAWIWPVISLLALWRLEPHPALAWLVPIQAGLVIVPALLAVPLARAAGCPPGRVGVVAVAAGVSNTGFTLGAYLCYVLLTPADQAMAVAVALLNVMVVTVILVLYPLAHHFSPHTQSTAVWRLVLLNFIDARALSLHATVAGIVLALLAVPRPAWLFHPAVLDSLFYLSALVCYLGIGLQLRAADAVRYVREHAVLAVAKFLIAPAFAAVCLWATTFTAAPVTGVVRGVVVIESLMPVGIMAVMIANLFGLDTRLASVAWVVNTLLFALLVMPVLIFSF